MEKCGRKFLSFVESRAFLIRVLCSPGLAVLVTEGINAIAEHVSRYPLFIQMKFSIVVLV